MTLHEQAIELAEQLEVLASFVSQREFYKIQKAVEHLRKTSKTLHELNAVRHAKQVLTELQV
jgi:hypothetical protein